MLLFIYNHNILPALLIYFNTSHVTVYPPNSGTLVVPLRYFNTSHVTVYRTTCYHLPIYIVKFQYISCYCLSVWNTALLPFCFIFQYISCYCLSSAVMYGSWSVFNFNTSHVTVYRFCFVPAAAVRDNFNTSHVTVYQSGESKDSRRNAFQYISCYCLSICGSFRSGSFQYFNTSHVTVYLNAVASARMSDSFQYISCYCLSVVSAVVAGMILYFNTSHVTVYRFLVCIWEWHIYSFQYISCYCLSELREYQPTEQFEFQYISCYCLSSPAFSIFFPIPDFNTSHVTVYPVLSLIWTSHTVISIHLMLLFIGIPAILDNSERYFNTSHVTVYPIRYRWGICV